MRLTDDGREQIIEALRANESQHSIAKRFGCNVSTVCRIAKAEGIASNIASTKNANAARRDYALAERLALLNRGFAKADELLSRIEKPSQLMQWMIAVGTLIDKRRLEDGQATSRTEVNADAMRERIAGRLDELAARRATKGDSERAV
jgi:hypothetical protein